MTTTILRKALSTILGLIVICPLVLLVLIYTTSPFAPAKIVTQYEIVKEYEATENKFTLKQISVCHEVTYSTSKWFGDGKPDDIFRRKVMSRQTLAKYCKKD